MDQVQNNLGQIVYKHIFKSLPTPLYSSGVLMWFLYGLFPSIFSFLCSSLEPLHTAKHTLRNLRS